MIPLPFKLARCYREIECIAMLASVSIFALLAGCGSGSGKRIHSGEFVPKRPSFVFVHGAFQTAESTWSEVAKQLEAKGFDTHLVKLPGRDCKDAELAKLNLDSYVNEVLKVLEAAEGNIILVGHSFGGISISQAAEKSMAKIEALVYLAAYLPQNGESLKALTKEDKASQLGQKGSLSVREDKLCVSITETKKTELFGKSGDKVISEPTLPMGGPVQLTFDKFGQIPKYYIHTKKDQVLSFDFQKLMKEKYKVTKSYELDADHAPYASHTSEVVQILEEIASPTSEVSQLNLVN